MLRRDGRDRAGGRSGNAESSAGRRWCRRRSGGENAGDGFGDARASDGDAGGKADLVDCVGRVSGGDVCGDDLVCGAAGLARIVQRA